MGYFVVIIDYQQNNHLYPNTEVLPDEIEIKYTFPIWPGSFSSFSQGLSGLS